MTKEENNVQKISSLLKSAQKIDTATMRLYNASSCTPVIAQNQLPERSAPKTYIPKAPTQRIVKDLREKQVKWPPRHDEDINVETAIESPKAKCGSHTNQDFAKSAATLVQQVGLFPTRNRNSLSSLSSDLKGLQIVEEEEILCLDECQDGISITSSSTLSTHTTLQHSVVQQPVITTTAPQSKGVPYGISTSFPSCAYRSMSSKFRLSPAKTERVVTEENDKSKPLSQRPECQFKPNGDPGSKKDSANSTRPKKILGSEVPKSATHYSAHLGFMTRMQGLREDNTAKKNCSSPRPCVLDNNRLLQPVEPDIKDVYPDPELSLTESSSDESTWFDFPKGGSENPFHDASFINDDCCVSSSGDVSKYKKKKLKKNVYFAPIEKPPLASHRRPLMTIKPRSLTSNYNIEQSGNGGLKRTSFLPLKPQTRKFPTQTLQRPKRTVPSSTNGFAKEASHQHQQHSTVSISRYTLKGPRSDSSAIFPKADFKNHHLHRHHAKEKESEQDREAPASPTSPNYSKYAAMFKAGIERDGVKQAMENDGVERSIIDLVLQAATARPSASSSDTMEL